MKLSGRIAFRDIETGVWVLEGDDGRTYQLAGGDRKIKKDGQRVEVEGNVDNDAVTLHMVGPVLTVASYKFL
ncbi:DUF5818 domain-containing protein [Hyalangium gracile]|uniref:DUF5818 domain-containing protein n=1 Tax=Hyalangium gracile TaxID=394092 RepID=UPI001CCF07EF|nr:DUF5818 domain-containing protein [Hyalangium gracile]